MQVPPQLAILHAGADRDGSPNFIERLDRIELLKRNLLPRFRVADMIE